MCKINVQEKCKTAKWGTSAWRLTLASTVNDVTSTSYPSSTGVLPVSSFANGDGDVMFLSNPILVGTVPNDFVTMRATCSNACGVHQSVEIVPLKLGESKHTDFNDVSVCSSGGSLPFNVFPHNHKF